MAESAEASISSLIGAVERGDAGAADALFAALYAELHRLARRELARHGTPVSLGVTTLLHEAYLDIAARSGPSFPDVDLKFFYGFSFAEVAAMRGVSERTVQRKWEQARIYLHRSIRAPSSL